MKACMYMLQITLFFSILFRLLSVPERFIFRQICRYLSYFVPFINILINFHDIQHQIFYKKCFSISFEQSGWWLVV